MDKDELQRIRDFSENEPHKWDDYTLSNFVAKSKIHIADLIEALELERSKKRGE